MIKIYMSPSCSSCRKVKAWFTSEGIPFREINILQHVITVEELKEILNKSLDGTDEIISTRSKVFQEQKVDLDSMSINDLCQFIKNNPTILKRPIIVDDKIIQVGYNLDEIEIFERAKKISSDCCQKGACPDYETCQHHFRDETAN
ncbi:MAG: transcriptional regulator Spx [Bacilli bacterium]